MCPCSRRSNNYCKGRKREEKKTLQQQQRQLKTEDYMNKRRCKNSLSFECVKCVLCCAVFLNNFNSFAVTVGRCCFFFTTIVVDVVSRLSNSVCVAMCVWCQILGNILSALQFQMLCRLNVKCWCWMVSRYKTHFYALLKKMKTISCRWARGESKGNAHRHRIDSFHFSF